MDNREDDRVVGWEVELCRPLTRRVMFMGVPYAVLAGFGLTLMQLVNLRLYALIPLLLPAFIGARVLYARDEWGVGAWLMNVRETTQGKNRMDV